MTSLDAGAGWLEPNEVGSSQYVCCVFLQSIGLPVFPTGAIVAAYSEREDMISLVPDLFLGWGGITDPCFMKYSLRVCLSALPTIARCPPGSYGKLHGQFCLIHLTDHLLPFLCSFLPCWLYIGLGWLRLGFTSKVS